MSDHVTGDPGTRDPSWSVYPSTIIDIDGPEGTVAVNLRFPVDARALPFGANAFGIVTAHNPLGRRVPAQENEERHRRLAARLADLGWRHVRATGRSADGHHAEPGFAVVAARPDLLAVAEAFGQTAIFWFDGDRFWLWPVRGDPMPLPSE